MECAAFEREVEGDLTDAGGGALGDSFDCFGDFGAVGGCEGAFFFDVLWGGWLAVGESKGEGEGERERNSKREGGVTRSSVFSRTITRSTGIAAPLTDLTGRTLAYRSSRLRRATMGEEYPSTFVLGELYTYTQ